MKKYLFMFVALLGLVPVFNASAQSSACSVDFFIASPSVVVSGQSSNITIKTSNCDKVAVSGLNPSNLNESLAVQANGSVSTGPLTSPRTFTVEASRGTSVVTKSLTVNTGPVTIANNANQQKAMTVTKVSKKATPVKTVAKASPALEVKAVAKKEASEEVAKIEEVAPAAAIQATTPTPKKEKKGFFGLLKSVFSSK